MNAACVHAARGALITHPGQVRTRHEDAYVCGAEWGQAPVTEPRHFACEAGAPWILAVVDGIGGQNSGDQASREVASRLSTCADCTPQGITRLLEDLNRGFYERGLSDPASAGLGAVVAGLASGPEGLFAFHVGDARIYRQQDTFLAQITQDDSAARILQSATGGDAGQVRPKHLHFLTQALGGQPQFHPVEPHVNPLRVTKSARFLLCTDGLTDSIPLEQMEAIVARHQDTADIVAGLFAEAMRAGGGDNITIVCALVQRMGDARLSRSLDARNQPP